jgi:phosphoenolpyruvate carboxylase
MPTRSRNARACARPVLASVVALASIAALASSAAARPRKALPVPGRTARTGRLAATTILTEHPSSLRLMKRQFRSLRRALRSPKTRANPNKLMDLLNKPLMTADKQVQEFSHLSLRRRVGSGKMIDFEGKPMPPKVIPRYVKAVERAGMTAGIEGDRALYVRLPGAAETSTTDRRRRRQIFKTIVQTNLKRVIDGRPLPVDRLIVAQTRSLDQLLEVHRTYDRVAAAAVRLAVRRGQLGPEQRAATLRRLKRIQVVPLVEYADTVMNVHTLLGEYMKRYAGSYGAPPKRMVVFVAGSDLNRQVGPVAAQISRTVMRSRLARLQEKTPLVDIVPWVGIGSGPMRSGVGRFPEAASMLHPGMTFTVQPDQVDQGRTLKRTLRAMGDSALKAQAPKLSASQERTLTALGSYFADQHASISLRHSLSRIRIANLLTPLKQRGRKNTAAKLLYQRDGKVFLRSVRPGEKGDGSTYGRVLDISGYTAQIDGTFPAERKRLERRQRSIGKLWPTGLSDPRAISGAFARYVEGNSLTTVCGLGLALQRAEAKLGRGQLASIRPFVTFLVKNDGFVLTKNRALVRQRVEVLRPELSRGQVDRQVRRYFADVAALERYLGQPIEKLVPRKERQRYDRSSRRLFESPQFKRYLQGQDISIQDWSSIMKRVVPLLSNPGWNRVG